MVKDGRKYFHHPRTGVTQWKCPPEWSNPREDLEASHEEVAVKTVHGKAKDRKLMSNELPGGYQSGDRVRSLTDVLPVRTGDIGIVTGVFSVPPSLTPSIHPVLLPFLPRPPSLCVPLSFSLCVMCVCVRALVFVYLSLTPLLPPSSLPPFPCSRSLKPHLQQVPAVKRTD